MSKPRPGVQAGINLIEQRDASDNDVLWKRVERHYHLVRDAIPRLAQYEANLQAMNMKSAAKKKKKENDTAAACVESSTAAADDATATTCTTRDSFNKQELLEIVQWKHSVGKNRAYNLKLLNANADDAVVGCTQKAVNCARKITRDDNQNNRGIQEALDHLTVLKGVGPATASAILCLVRPDIFCYMYDEVIDCFEKKRDYKMAQYLRVNEHCHEIAQKLDWTTARVAKAIWTACRYLALTGKHLTEAEPSSSQEISDNADNVKQAGDKKNDHDENNKKPRAKRKRR